MGKWLRHPGRGTRGAHSVPLLHSSPLYRPSIRSHRRDRCRCPGAGWSQHPAPLRVRWVPRRPRGGRPGPDPLLALAARPLPALLGVNRGRGAARRGHLRRDMGGGGRRRRPEAAPAGRSGRGHGAGLPRRGRPGAPPASQPDPLPDARPGPRRPARRSSGHRARGPPARLPRLRGGPVRPVLAGPRRPPGRSWLRRRPSRRTDRAARRMARAGRSRRLPARRSRPRPGRYRITSGRANRSTRWPFGTFLAAGAIVALAVDPSIVF